MKVLLVAMKYDYGDPRRGPSGMDEYFTQPLQRMVDEVLVFDFVQSYQRLGRAGMNAALLELVRQSRPDMALFVLFRDEFVPEVITQISAVTITVAYTFDDVWRIDYTRSWSRHFSFATTSDPQGVERWAQRGCQNFLYSPFAVNCAAFRKLDLPLKYDVSFVGGYHPYREWLVDRLRRAGISVKVWGHDWPDGRLTMPEMVNVFNQSRINLNLSNNEQGGIRYLLGAGRSWRQRQQAWKSAARLVLRRDAKKIEMVKGRHFEINACGGFQLSYTVAALAEHYTIGKELDVFRDADDMIAKIHYYLAHSQDRAAIALAGHARTLNCHTAERRFAELFKVIHERRRSDLMQGRGGMGPLVSPSLESPSS